MDDKDKKTNSENGKATNKKDDKAISKSGKNDFFDLDWIFDKGWLRTKK